MLPYGVSIHAPHEGERHSLFSYLTRISTVSIHAPHEGERLICRFCSITTRSSFNPRSPRGGATPRSPLYRVCGLCFNPRSPRGGATFLCILLSGINHMFQSTLPTRGSDQGIKYPYAGLVGFNPRSPRGGATIYSVPSSIRYREFQSTLPTRGSDGGKVHLYAAFPRIY